MIIGVTGDTHNNLKNIKIICSIFNENRVDLVFHTGDITLPKSLLAFRELECPLRVVFGNNDIGDKTDLIEASKSFKCDLNDEPLKMNIQGRKFAVIHHPELIDERMIKENDYIFHGHTHRYRLENIHGCTIFNPGECAGFMKDKNQVGILNLDKSEPQIINF